MPPEEGALSPVEDTDGNDYILQHARSCWVEVGPWALYIREIGDGAANGVIVEAYKNGEELGNSYGTLMLANDELEDEEE